MKRRNFFQSLAQTAAIIALAPQLAFRVRPELPSVTLPEDSAQISAVYDLMRNGVKCGCVGWGRLPLEQHMEHRKYLKANYQLRVRILEIYNNESDMCPLVLKGAEDTDTVPPEIRDND